MYATGAPRVRRRIGASEEVVCRPLEMRGMQAQDSCCKKMYFTSLQIITYMRGARNFGKWNSDDSLTSIREDLADVFCSGAAQGARDSVVQLATHAVDDFV